MSSVFCLILLLAWLFFGGKKAMKAARKFPDPKLYAPCPVCKTPRTERECPQCHYPVIPR